MGDVKAFVTKWCAGHDSGTLGPKIRADLESLLASERALATARDAEMYSASHERDLARQALDAANAEIERLKGQLSQAVGRAWIAEEIRALSPEGFVGVRRDDLDVLCDAAAELEARIRAERKGYDATRADEIRAALDAAKEG